MVPNSPSRQREVFELDMKTFTNLVRAQWLVRCHCTFNLPGLRLHDCILLVSRQTVRRTFKNKQCKGFIYTAYELKGKKRELCNPKDAEGCSGCHHKLPNGNQILEFEDKLCDIIGREQISILSMDPTATDLDIKLESYNGLQSFTAISYVWSDCIGNGRHNQVLKCQLDCIAKEIVALRKEKRRLTNLVERFYSEDLLNRSKRVYFWLVT